MSVRQAAKDFLDDAAEVVVLLLWFLVIGMVLKLMAPIITTLLVLLATGYAMEKGRGILAAEGVILYALSWPVSAQYGAHLSQVVWALGMLIWFMAIFYDMRHIRPYLSGFGAR